MVAPVISPPGGGTYSTTSRTETFRIQSLATETNTYYTLSAVAAEGFNFGQWKWKTETGTYGQTKIREHSSLSAVKTMLEYTIDYDAGGVDFQRVFDVQLVFVSDGGIYITVNASPAAGQEEFGSADPPTQRQRVYIGSSATFTVNASPAADHNFLGWKRDGGSGFVSRSRVYTFTESATTSKTINLYAHFGNGRILYGSGGRIVFGSNGQPVFSG